MWTPCPFIIWYPYEENDDREKKISVPLTKTSSHYNITILWLMLHVHVSQACEDSPYPFTHAYTHTHTLINLKWRNATEIAFSPLNFCIFNEQIIVVTGSSWWDQ